MKRKIWTVTPFFIAYTVGIFAMAIFAYRWNLYVFAIELTIAILSTIVVVAGMRQFSHHINRTIKQAAPNLEVHISTQANCCNYASALAYHEMPTLMCLVALVVTAHKNQQNQKKRSSPMMQMKMRSKERIMC